ncbi:hypothetical protein [Bacillus alkalicellulosilyticus]|uniref:hypothetical protein n=1 Tax=Alkalihalobacterium alkalicellulosilyticum TaxID=1912214 RepID=UPI0009966B24|nr:hypothetical protein [Bacillus alkalicellulosilyticus]
MSKLPFMIVVFLLLTLLISGCSFLSSSTDGDEMEEKTEVTEENKTDEETSSSEDPVEPTSVEEGDETDTNEIDTSAAVAPNQSLPEISVQNITWYFGVPDRQPNAGIWVYTEDNHPSALSNVNFDNNDVLLVQISNEEYYGSSMDIRALQVVDENVVRIVVRLDEPEPDSNEQARRYANVPKGELDGKSFIVETEDGEPLSVQ